MLSFSLQRIVSIIGHTFLLTLSSSKCAHFSTFNAFSGVGRYGRRHAIKLVSRKRRAILAYRSRYRARVGQFTHVSTTTAGALDYIFRHFPATMVRRHFPHALQAYLRLAKDERRDPVWNGQINAVDRNLSKIKERANLDFDTGLPRKWEQEDRDLEKQAIGAFDDGHTSSLSEAKGSRFASISWQRSFSQNIF